jgi:cysteine-rich repeat protein
MTRRTSRVLALVSLFVCVAAPKAHAQSKSQVTCITSMNKAGTKVASTQGKENSACIGAATSGKLVGQDADQCIDADNKGKVAKATVKTADTQAAKCAFPLPSYGFTSATTVNASALGAEKTLVEQVFGSPVASAILTDKPGGGCQSSVAKSYEKFAAARTKAFVSCKTNGFKLGTIGNAAGLVSCVDDDELGKVQIARDSLLGTITSKCAETALATAFPGCSAEAGSSQSLADCIARKAECQNCLLFEQMDNIDAPCDQLDDGNLNQTCRQCQNGATEAPEECDDGAESVSCDTDCTFASCGDSKVNATRGEACDKGGEHATCDDDCTPVACGDGNTNQAAGEVCDDGDTISGNGCDANCKPTGCGNGIPTAGEVCDDGNTVSGDGCDVNCTPTGCGNGVTTSGETCDDGNTISGDSCDVNCTPTGCGNGVVTAGEACDSSGVNTAVCDSDCTLPACHDGIFNAPAGEACDDGNLSNNDKCVGSCVVATCGDGFVCSAGGCNTGPSGGVEQCDNAGANSNVTPDACRTTCKLPSCGDNVTDSGEFCDTGGNAPLCDANCTAASCGDGFVNPAAGETCDGGGETATCDLNCTARVCGDGTKNVTAGEECDDGNTVSGDLCSSTCACGAGSGELGCQDPQCPGKGQLTLLAGAGATCTTNGDCLAGQCTSGRCVTPSSLDAGWTGISHGADINDKVDVMGRLLCSGPGPTCGQCQVIGLLSDFGNCRCANNTRTVCTKPFAADSASCGPTNNTCNCYLGPPLPLSSGGVAACVVNRFAENISGTANVDTGAGKIDAKLKSVVYLGVNNFQPCSVCGGTCTAPPAKVGIGCGQDIDCETSVGSGDGVCGNFDPTPKDGVRGGKCFGGTSDGQSCDVQAYNTTFPAPQGAGHSLDCFPNTANVSGTGLNLKLSQTTGHVELPAAALPCNFGFSVCPCGECSNDVLTPCSSNSDCVSPGTCGTAAEKPNGCIDGVCNDLGGEQGECTPNSPNAGDNVVKTCDGVLRANGKGFLGCIQNTDCSAANIGIVGGNCTMSETQKCFLDPIKADGVQDAAKPLGVAALCIPKTSSTGINSVAGLPGPARVKNQAKSTLYCAGAPLSTYTPGVGGCP